MKIWYITIWDGVNEIDHHFIDISLSAQEVFTYCLNSFYGENSPYEIFRDIEDDETMILEVAEDKECYDVYCTNLIPDISIEKIEIQEISKKDIKKIRYDFVNYKALQKN